MPIRKKPIMKAQEIKGFSVLATLAFDDVRVALDLCLDNDSPSYSRILIRTFVVALEAYYSSAIYTIELNRLLSKNIELLEVSDYVLPASINLDFNSTEIDFIYDSRSNSLNAKRLKALIKLVEKTFLTSEFDFGTGDTWALIRDIFEKRNDFTHPRNIEDFSTGDVGYLIKNGLHPLLEHLEMLHSASTKGTMVSAS